MAASPAAAIAATPQPLPSVLVACRVRPFVSRSDGHESSGAPILELSGRTVKSRDPSSGRALGFGPFDALFGPASTQEEVFDAVGRPIVEAALQGVNATILAYGQTGSGKTHTMHGGGGDRGITPRVVAGIFDGISNAPETLEFMIRVSYVEIYLERVRDLLNPSAANLTIRQSAEQGVFVEGVVEEYVGSNEELLELVRVGDAHRAVGATGMNESSSRSHSIITIHVLARDTLTGSARTSRLCLVDLAGSEAVSRTGAEGSTLNEAKTINKSLFTLSLCISTLASQAQAGAKAAARVQQQQQQHQHQQHQQSYQQRQEEGWEGGLMAPSPLSGSSAVALSPMRGAGGGGGGAASPPPAGATSASPPPASSPSPPPPMLHASPPGALPPAAAAASSVALLPLEHLKRPSGASEGGGSGGGLPQLPTPGAPGAPDQPPPSHIPYRDSKLTRLLQDSLGGNARTALIVCCSPSPINLLESLSTLRFGTQAKLLPNAPVVNRVRSTAELERMLAKYETVIHKQTELIRLLQGHLRDVSRAKRRRRRRAAPSGSGEDSGSGGSSDEDGSGGSSDEGSASCSSGEGSEGGGEHGSARGRREGSGSGRARAPSASPKAPASSSSGGGGGGGGSSSSSSSSSGGAGGADRAAQAASGGGGAGPGDASSAAAQALALRAADAKLEEERLAEENERLREELAARSEEVSALSSELAASAASSEASRAALQAAQEEGAALCLMRVLEALRGCVCRVGGQDSRPFSDIVDLEGVGVVHEAALFSSQDARAASARAEARLTLASSEISDLSGLVENLKSEQQLLQAQLLAAQQQQQQQQQTALGSSAAKPEVGETAAAVIADLQAKLSAMLNAHRQLLRKFAVVDAEATEISEQLQVRPRGREGLC